MNHDSHILTFDLVLSEVQPLGELQEFWACASMHICLSITHSLQSHLVHLQKIDMSVYKQVVIWLSTALCMYAPTAESEQRADILRLRRRFLKDQVKVSMTFARKEIHEQKQRKVQKRFTYILFCCWTHAANMPRSVTGNDFVCCPAGR